MLALRNKEVGAKRQVTGFVISSIIGLLLGVYLSVVTGQVSTLAEAPARYQSFLYQSQLWELSWQAFKDHWFTGVGMRGFGTYALATDASAIRVLRRTWHSHLTILEVISETGLVGLIGYGLLLRWLWGYVQGRANPRRCGWFDGAACRIPVGHSCGDILVHWRQSHIFDLYLANCIGQRLPTNHRDLCAVISLKNDDCL